MRYQADHKERTRQQIVETASRLFRRDGVVGTGVVPLMKEAGLTQGGFYAHFPSKEVLVREAAEAALDQTVAGLGAVAHAAGDGVAGLQAIVEAYLSEAHLGRVDNGCAMAAIGAELAREPEETRAAVMAGAHRLVALIQAHLPAGDEDPSATAAAVFALLSGTLQLARVTPDHDEALRLLRRGRKAALALAAMRD